MGLPFFREGTLGEEAAVAAMKDGAHDYIVKGNWKRLAPAIERELREAEVRRERRQAEEKIRRQEERIRVLHEINLAITSTLDLRSVLDLLLGKIELILPYPVAMTVTLYNKDTEALELLASRNLDELDWKGNGNGWGSGRSLAEVVFETRNPMIIRNLQANPGVVHPEFFRKRGLVSYLGVALAAKEEVLGVLGLYTRKEHEFTSEEIEFLSTLAGQAAIAIHNSQLHEQIKEQAAELEVANGAKAEFLSFVSHELRTPLTVVMGYTDMIRNKGLGWINQEQEAALAKVIGHSNELVSMINSLLEASKIEAQRVETELHDFHLGHFLDELRVAYDIPLGKSVTLSWYYPADLPVVKTDRWKLKHILQNLITNAIKFTDEGRVAITARHSSTTGMVEFKVADTGIGIPKESLSEIFEMFRKAGGSRTRGRTGVGLGLHIVKKFTELLGGKIQVKSEPGKGSTFTVTIPTSIPSRN